MSHALRASRLTPIWVLLATLLIVGFAAGHIAGPTHGPSRMVAAYVDVNGNDVDQIIDLQELNRSINECLLLMPEKYRQVYTLHKQYGYTLKKTSYLLKRPVDTVEKQYRRIIHLIREHLCERQLYPSVSLHRD